jgi:hypothetical protein
MDLRDQFAMAAMQGMLASGIKAKSHISENAYEYADAMIEVREKDDVETKDQIKQMLVDAIKEEHPDMQTSAFLPARDLIYQLTTGLPF